MKPVLAAITALLDRRSSSLRSRYDADVRELFAEVTVPSVLTEADVARVPPLIQTYLRRAGVVGRPRVRTLEVRFRGELRNGERAPWMKIRAEQREAFGPSPLRLFFAEGSMHGLPFDAYHRKIGTIATMEVTALSLAKIVDARGPEMNQSETVTLFNDMCLLAPATLLDADIDWRTTGARTVEATFRSAGQTISAELTFDATGDLSSFTSSDRYMSADGKTYRNHVWSTPVSDYRKVDGVRVPAYGEAIWSLPQGDFVYVRFTVEELRYNVEASTPHGARRSAGVASRRTHAPGA